MERSIASGAADCGKHAVRHAFAASAPAASSILPLARRAGRALAASLQTALEPLARESLIISAGELEVVTCDRWMQQQGKSDLLALYRLLPLRGHLALLLPHDWLAALVEACFGGSIHGGAVRAARVTTTDRAMAARIASSAAQAVSRAWMPLGPFRCEEAGPAGDSDTAALGAGDASLLVQPLCLRYSDHASFALSCVMPATLVQAAQALVKQGFDADHQDDPAWTHALTASVAQAHLPVRSVLARPTMSMHQLATLQTGALIPILPPNNLQLLVGERVFARGTLGEKDGVAALRINSFIEE